MFNHRVFVCLIVVVVLIAGFSAINAELPKGINYQGKLFYSGGPVNDDARGVRLRLFVDGNSNGTYDGEAAGDTLIWGWQTDTIEVDYGLFSIVLADDDTAGNIGDVLDHSNITLEVQVDDEEHGGGYILLGTEEIWSVPYALNAEGIGGTEGPFVQFHPTTAQATGDITTPMIHLNEDGAYTGDLLDIEVGGNNRLILTNDGDLKIAGDLYTKQASIHLCDAGDTLVISADIDVNKKYVFPQTSAAIDTVSVLGRTVSTPELAELTYINFVDDADEDPAAVTGGLYYNSAAHELRYHDSWSWVPIAGGTSAQNWIHNRDAGRSIVYTYETTDSVGIGTINPAYRLDVQGEIGITRDDAGEDLPHLEFDRGGVTGGFYLGSDDKLYYQKANESWEAFEEITGGGAASGSGDVNYVTRIDEIISRPWGDQIRLGNSRIIDTESDSLYMTAPLHVNGYVKMDHLDFAELSSAPTAREGALYYDDAGAANNFKYYDGSEWKSLATGEGDVEIPDGAYFWIERGTNPNYIYPPFCESAGEIYTRIYEDAANSKYGFYYNRHSNTPGSSSMPMDVYAGIVSLEPGIDNKEHHYAIYGATEINYEGPNAGVFGIRVNDINDAADDTFFARGAIAYRAKNAGEQMGGPDGGGWVAGVAGEGMNRNGGGTSIGVFARGIGKFERGVGGYASMINYAVYCEDSSAIRMPTISALSQLGDDDGYDDGSFIFYTGGSDKRLAYSDGGTWYYLVASTTPGAGEVTVDPNEVCYGDPSDGHVTSLNLPAADGYVLTQNTTGIPFWAAPGGGSIVSGTQYGAAYYSDTDELSSTAAPTSVNQTLHGNPAGAPTWSTTVSADIENGTIVDEDINASADIAITKLSNGTDGQVLKTVGTTPTWSAGGLSTVSVLEPISGDGTAGDPITLDYDTDNFAVSSPIRIKDQGVSAAELVTVTGAAPGAGQDGQVLKWDNSESKFEWANDIGSGGGSLPTGGTQHQALIKQSGTDYDADWEIINDANMDELDFLKLDKLTAATSPPAPPMAQTTEGDIYYNDTENKAYLRVAETGTPADDWTALGYDVWDRIYNDPFWLMVPKNTNDNIRSRGWLHAAIPGHVNTDTAATTIGTRVVEQHLCYDNNWWSDMPWCGGSACNYPLPVPVPEFKGHYTIDSVAAAFHGKYVVQGWSDSGNDYTYFALIINRGLASETACTLYITDVNWSGGGVYNWDLDPSGTDVSPKRNGVPLGITDLDSIHYDFWKDSGDDLLYTTAVDVTLYYTWYYLENELGVGDVMVNNDVICAGEVYVKGVALSRTLADVSGSSGDVNQIITAGNGITGTSGVDDGTADDVTLHVDIEDSMGLNLIADGDDYSFGLYTGITNNQILEWNNDDSKWRLISTPTGASASDLNDLQDVNAAGYSGGRILIDDGTNSWDAQTMGGDATLASNGTITISSNAIGSAEITDGTVATGDMAANASDAVLVSDGTVQWSAATSDKYLKYDGTNFTWDTPSGSGATDLNGLTDCVVSGYTGGNILIADNSNSYDQQTMGGDATLASDGTLDLVNDAVQPDEIDDPGTGTWSLLSSSNTSVVAWTTDAPSSGEYLQYNGSGFVWGTPSGTGASNLQEAYTGGNTIVTDGSNPVHITAGDSDPEALYVAGAGGGNAIKTGGTNGSIWVSTGNIQVDAGNVTLSSGNVTVSAGQVNATSTAGGTEAIYANNTLSGNAIVTGVSGATPGTNTGHIWMRNSNLQIDEGQITVYAASPAGSEKTFNVDLNGDVYVRGSIYAEGTNDNVNETKLAFTDPTADRIITFPDATGTVALEGSIDLTSDVTGILPVANGGTNSSTALNNDRVIVSSGGSIIESATITTTELGLLNGIVSVSTGAGDNDKFVTQGYVDDEISGITTGDQDWDYFSGSGLTGDIYHTGDVGIGLSTDPQAPLHVYRTADYQFRLDRGSSDYADMWATAAGYLEIRPSGSAIRLADGAVTYADFKINAGDLNIAATGNVGINIDAPLQTFHIYNTNDSQLRIDRGSGDYADVFATAAGYLEIRPSGHALSLSYDASNYTYFTISSGGDLNIDASGNDVTIEDNLTLNDNDDSDNDANLIIGDASEGGYIHMYAGSAPAPVSNKLYAVGTNLYWNGEQLEAGAHTHALTDLSDVTVTGTEGDLLYHNGTVWAQLDGSGTDDWVLAYDTDNDLPFWKQDATGGTVSGSGTVNTIAKFTPTSSDVGNSNITDDGYQVSIANSITGSATARTWMSIDADITGGNQTNDMTGLDINLDDGANSSSGTNIGINVDISGLDAAGSNIAGKFISIDNNDIVELAGETYGVSSVVLEAPGGAIYGENTSSSVSTNYSAIYGKITTGTTAEGYVGFYNDLVAGDKTYAIYGTGGDYAGMFKGTLAIKEASGDQITSFACGAQAADIAYTLPISTSDNKYLKHTTGGTLEWADAGSGTINDGTQYVLAYYAGTSTIDDLSTGVGNAGQVMRSAGAGSEPAWSTATYPNTTTINQILYSSAANTISGIATANGGILVTNGSGVPSIIAGTDNQVLVAHTGAIPTWEDYSDNNTATAADDILEGTNIDTEIKYAPWAVGDKAAGRLYSGTTDPTNTTRLNYDGYFYATKLYAGGAEVGASQWTDVPASDYIRPTGDAGANVKIYYDGASVGKIDAKTVDPVIEIGGAQYATYCWDGVGQRTEFVAEGKLIDGEYRIDLAKQAKASDMWLFYNVVVENSIVPFVTPQDEVYLMARMEGSVLYVKAIWGKQDARFSIRLSGVRIDMAGTDEEINIRKDMPGAHIIREDYDKDGNKIR